MAARLLTVLGAAALVVTGCAYPEQEPKSSPAAVPEKRATVQVVDPDGHWTEPERPQDAGCTPDGASYPLPPSTGPTEWDAVAAMAAENYRAEWTTYEVHYLRGGYRKDDSPGGPFVLRLDGRSVATGAATRAEDGTWSAQVHGSCAERLGPSYDPMARYDGEHDDPLRIICTASGARVEPAVVRAAVDGVRAELVNAADRPALYLAIENGDGAQTLSADDHDLTRPTWLTPGRHRLGCTSAEDDTTLSTTVTVTDPNRNWRPGELERDCALGGQFYALGAYGDSELEALHKMTARSTRPPRIRLYDDGWWRAPGHRWASRDEGSTEVYHGRTSQDDSGRWHASIDGNCRLIESTP